VKILLGSGSPRRAALLQQIGIKHRVVKPMVSEIENASSPEQLLKANAMLKLKAVADHLQTDETGLVADTIVVMDNTIMGKPNNSEEAAEMLIGLAGKTHMVMTGFAVFDHKETRYDVEKTEVTFKTLSADEIAHYIDSGEGFDKAGGYGIQGQAAVFVEKINGCYFNVVGLPLAAIYKYLMEVFSGK
jgi:septum formation protein